MFTAHSNCILWFCARFTVTIPLSSDGLCFLVVLRNTPPRTFWIRAILLLRQFWQTDSTSDTLLLTATHSHSLIHSLYARHWCQPNIAICWSRTGTSPDHGGSRPGNANHWWTHWSGWPAWTACYRDTESMERSLNRHNPGSCWPPGNRRNTLEERRGGERGGEREELWGEAKGEKGRKRCEYLKRTRSLS